MSRRDLRGALAALLALLALLVPAVAVANDERLPPATPDAIVAEIDAGQFAMAESDIGDALRQPRLAPAVRAALEFQRERMRRILLDFTLSAADVRTRLREQIPDLADAEFADWDALTGWLAADPRHADIFQQLALLDDEIATDLAGGSVEIEA